MNSKKSLITIIVVIVVLVAGGLLWRGGFLGYGTGTVYDSALPTGGTTQPGVEGQTGEQATGGQTGTVGKMTDDIYIELITQAAYQAQNNPSAYASNMKNLYDKYGVTAENIQAYGEALSKDPARAQAVGQKYAQQLQQLMKK